MPRGLPIEKPLPEDFVEALPGNGAIGVTAHAMVAPEMPAEVSTGFGQVLELLNGTQVSLVHEMLHHDKILQEKFVCVACKINERLFQRDNVTMSRWGVKSVWHGMRGCLRTAVTFSGIYQG